MTSFVWRELRTTDPTRAEAFYGGMFGWGVTWAPGGDRMLYYGDHAIGAMAQDPHTEWIPFVSVPDVDIPVALAAEQGGMMRVPPMDLEDGGRYAILADRQGAAVGVISPVVEGPTHRGSGFFGHCELHTTNAEDATRFYRGVFGGIDGVIVQARTPHPSHWLPCVEVEDLVIATERARDLHGRVFAAGTEDGGRWRSAVIRDPQGGVVGLFERGKS